MYQVDAKYSGTLSMHFLKFVECILDTFFFFQILPFPSFSHVCTAHFCGCRVSTQNPGAVLVVLWE